jgi:hypothetical protein
MKKLNNMIILNKDNVTTKSFAFQHENMLIAGRSEFPDVGQIVVLKKDRLVLISSENIQ